MVFERLSYCLVLQDVLTDKLNPMELAVTFSQSEPPYARPRSGDPLPNINTYPVLSTTGAMEAEPNTVSTLVYTFSFLSTSIFLYCEQHLHI